MYQSNYFVYIKTNESHLYFDVGIADNIIKTLLDQQANASHQADPIMCGKLVYYEYGHTLVSATARCQRLIKLPSSKRLDLIERHNPSWQDLSMDWVK